MIRARSRTRPQARTQEVPVGPFRAVVDATDPNSHNSQTLFDAVNMYAADASRDAAIVARPGMMGLGTQMGQAGGRFGQEVWEHRRRDGTLDRFIICGGKLYTWDGATTFTDVTPGTQTISTTARVYCCSFQDYLIVTDGVSRPWAYDPEAGTGSNIEVNTAGDSWRAFGRPTVYGGKLFFVVDGIGDDTFVTQNDDTLITQAEDVLFTQSQAGYLNMLVWSEEADHTIGYRQSGYVNFWELTQSSNDPIYAIQGTEEALFYFRVNSIGAITGTVNTDFQAASTRDTVSTTVGTTTPASVVLVDRTIFFLDAEGRPHRLVIGGGEPQELWTQVRRVTESNIGATSNASNVESIGYGAYNELLEVVLFTSWNRTAPMAFDARTGGYLGTWQFYGGAHVDAMRTFTDSSGRKAFCFLGTTDTTYSTANQGYLSRSKFTADTNQWLDQASHAVATYTALTRAVESGPISSGQGARLQVVGDAVAARLTGDSSAHSVRLQVVTPSAGLGTASTASSTAVTGEMSATDAISLAEWGLAPADSRGSYLRLRFSATHSDNHQFGVHDATLRCRFEPTVPGVA